MRIHLGTNRVHKDELADFEAECLMKGWEIDVKGDCWKGTLHVNVSRTYVPPKSRKKVIKDIVRVLKWSDKVRGSCTHAYMGSMAFHSYEKILDGKTLATAAISQVIEAHKLVFGYLASIR